VFFVGFGAFDQLRVFLVAFRDLNPRYCAALVALWDKLRHPELVED